MIAASPALHDAQTLAEAIIDTIHEPFLVLNADLRVRSASRSFCETFKVQREQTHDCHLYALGDGQWDIPALRTLLETIIPERTVMDNFEVDHDFPGLGRRTMLLNARKVLYETSADSTILLAFTDVTERRRTEREKAELLARTEELLDQKHVLLQEMEHRVANSLQIIASILLLKARAVTSEETRTQLRDAHQRVMSVAAVQSHLHATAGIDRVSVGPYLTKLCGSLADSMIGDDRPIALKVVAGVGEIRSAQAVSLGLIVTELVINAVKYAFPKNNPGSQILVTFDIAGDGWVLSVGDNGVGKADDGAAAKAAGLGTVIVNALVKQLEAGMIITSDDAGYRVTMSHPVGGLHAA